MIDADAGTRSHPAIADSFSVFDALVREAEARLGDGDAPSAAMGAAMAAFAATQKHAGVFASPRLERLLLAIGRSLPNPASGGPACKRSGEFREILHVCTQLADVGGLTRMIRRWMDADDSRTYSVALTQHRGPVPEWFSGAVSRSGGRIYHLNHRPGGMLDWAKDLRDLARRFDLVVLHIHCEDVIPAIAFAEPARCPPVLLLNHADHLFWVGSSISHLVINLRDAAATITTTRRGVPPERSRLMPTNVDPVVRTRSRREARTALGLDPDTVLLVSVARGAKYRTLDGVTFADWHVPVLRAHPRAALLVVGPGDPEDWRAARAAVSGRIISLPELTDPGLYFEAADIYVDSYPFVSSTSMMEAGGHGLPLVTLFTAPPEARIFGINHVGLVGPSMICGSPAEYTATLSRLIGDAVHRHAMGEAAREAVTRVHTPPGWLEWLEAIYGDAARLPPVDTAALLAGDEIETPSYGEPDRRHQDIVGRDFDMADVIKGYMGMLPPRQHLGRWFELRNAGAFDSAIESVSYLLPEWLKRRLKDRSRSSARPGVPRAGPNNSASARRRFERRRQ